MESDHGHVLMHANGPWTGTVKLASSLDSVCNVCNVCTCAPRLQVEAPSDCHGTHALGRGQACAGPKAGCDSNTNPCFSVWVRQNKLWCSMRFDPLWSALQGCSNAGVDDSEYGLAYL